MLTGQYQNSIDDKGRLLVPAKVRNEIAGTALYVTRGVEKALWLFTPEEWAKFSQGIMNSLSTLSSKARMIQRRIIAPAQELNIDKAGRINLPPSLMEHAGLDKECVLLGLGRRMEIWDSAAYNAYLDETEDDFQNAVEDMSDLLL